MPTGALIGAGSLGSALIGSSGAKKAASIQAAAARESGQLQLGMYNQTRDDLAPYTRVGTGAVGSLAELYGIDPATGNRTGQPFSPASLEAFRRSPDYEFARTEGLRGVEFSNAGRGLLRSGNNMRDLMQFGQGLATQTFGNYRGALQQLAQLGQGATGQLTQANIAAGQGMGNAATQAGAANASGVVGSANAWSGALGQLGNYAMTSHFINQMRPQQQMGTTLSAYAPASPGMPGFNPSPFPTGFPPGYF